MKPNFTISSILSILIPTLIECRSSKYSQKLTVYKLLGTYRVVAGNLTQSGGLVRTIWKKVVKYLDKRHFKIQKPQNILILGLGAGSMVEWITKTWPQAQITGLEIDPIMIQLGKKYFKLNQITNLRVINTDAFKWLEKNKQKFNLILIDLYLGCKLPPQVETMSFLKNIKSHLHSSPTQPLSLEVTRRDSSEVGDDNQSSSIAVFNRLALKGQKLQNQQFAKKLNQIFSHVSRIPTVTNWLIQVY